MCRSPAVPLPPGFGTLMAAQFCSALADNALLIVSIALLHQQGLPVWWAPLLKLSFTVAYVVLAPFVGPIADAWPKARVMAWMNGLKMAGTLLLLFGANPLLAFGVIGIGASVYAPAKYGLVTELVGPEGLVKANGWIEVSVVCAALLGTLLGGFLLSDLFQAAMPPDWAGTDAGIATLLAVYALAAALNIGVPDSGVRYPRGGLSPAVLIADFMAANRLLWRDRLGGLSLAVTTLFWGVGAMMQFAVLRWADVALGLGLSQASYLQAVVAVGVISGAAVAGRQVALGQALRVLPAGIALGLLLPAIAMTTEMLAAVPLLVLIGAVGGLLVVPMNALLQHRGHVLLTAGRSIAVQNFNENLSVLLTLAAYAGLLALELSIVSVMWLAGLAIAGFVAGVMWRARRGGRRAASPAADAAGHQRR